MKIKNFLRKTRPHGKAELRQCISDAERQIKYLTSIGMDGPSVKWLNREKAHWEEKLARMIANENSNAV